MLLNNPASDVTAFSAATSGFGDAILGDATNLNSGASGVFGRTFGTGAGVTGSSSKGVGLVGTIGTAGKAQLRLIPASSSGAPSAGLHNMGEIFLDHDGVLFLCKFGTGGDVGTWVRVGFNPLTPVRVCDTRAGSGKPFAGQPLGQGGELTISFLGNGGVPTTGASAVVFNLTMATCTADGWLTAYPAGESLPDTSNLNFAANQSPKANLVTVKLGTGGGVKINNARGTTNVIVDLFGFYS
jgi:hypothetical protein